jgi:hypothetical protein
MRIEELLCSQASIKLNKNQKPNLTNLERKQIYYLLSERSYEGKLPKGIITHLSLQFNVNPRTISRIWKQGQRSISDGLQYPNVESRIKFKSGRKKKLTFLALHSQKCSLMFKTIILNYMN